MNDGVMKGTGNSRYLKSVSNFLSLYPTYTDCVSALVAGTLPVDFNGINASGWTVQGSPLNKANLLPDDVAATLGLAVNDNPQVKDALEILSIGDNRALVVVTVYETNTSTPIPNVAITGITKADGSEAFADANGIARGYTTTTSTTISVNSEYADLTVTPLTISTPLGRRVFATIYATRKTVSDVTVTTSKYLRFSDKVASVDVHVIGGGEDGGMYSYMQGGKGGLQRYATVVPSFSQRYQAVIGTAYGFNSTPTVSSFMGVSSLNGNSSGERGSAGTAGGSNTVKKYGTGTTAFAGGAGGGGAQYGGNPGGGGSPNGGPGGAVNGNGSPASGYGGGGGGAGYNLSTPTSGGAGYQGAVFYTWRYKTA